MPRIELGGVLWSTLFLAAAATPLNLLQLPRAFRTGPSQWALPPGELRPSLITASVPKLWTPLAEDGGCSFDHSGLNEVLQKFVKPPRDREGIRSTVFDYKALHGSSDDLSKLNNYVKSLASFQPSCLSSNGKLAFWANAYNGLIIHLVMRDVQKNDGRLPKSIRDLAGDAETVWGREAGTIGGQAMSLEDVLSEGRKLGDPRIHAAVNCASLSCPDLRAKAYCADDVQADFDEQVKKWLQNPTKGAKGQGGKLKVSHIFDWHADDFPDVSSFVAGSLGLPSSSIQVTGYLPYNWDLNRV